MRAEDKTPHKEIRAERSGHSRVLWCSHDDKLQQCAHVRTLHLISHQHTPPMSAVQTGQAHREGMRPAYSSNANHQPSLSTHTILSCLAACVTGPFVAQLSPPTHFLLQFISLLSWHFHSAFCPWSHYVFTFQAFSWPTLILVVYPNTHTLLLISCPLKTGSEVSFKKAWSPNAASEWRFLGSAQIGHWCIWKNGTCVNRRASGCCSRIYL